MPTATERSASLNEAARKAKATADDAAQALQAAQTKVAQLRQARIDAQAATSPDTTNINKLKKRYAEAMGEVDEADIEARAKAQAADAALNAAHNFRQANYKALLDDLKPEDERVRAELLQSIRRTVELNDAWFAVNTAGHQLVVLSGERVVENSTSGHSLGPALNALRHVADGLQELESALPHWRYRDRREENQRYAEQKAAEAEAEQQAKATA